MVVFLIEFQFEMVHVSWSSRQQHSSPSRNTWKRFYCNDRTH